MAILKLQQRRIIESAIRNYHYYKKDIHDWEQEIIHGGKKDKTELIQQQRISDPTGIAGMKLANPPDDIKEMIAWVQAVEYVQKQVEDLDKGKLFEKWFWSDIQQYQRDAAEILFVSDRHLRRQISEILEFVALVAAEKGVFKPTEYDTKM